MIDYENKKEKLKLLEKERESITKKMRAMMIHNRQKATTEYDELKEKLYKLDMQVIEIKEILEEEGETDG